MDPTLPASHQHAPAPRISAHFALLPQGQLAGRSVALTPRRRSRRRVRRSVRGCPRAPYSDAAAGEPDNYGPSAPARGEFYRGYRAAFLDMVQQMLEQPADGRRPGRDLGVVSGSCDDKALDQPCAVAGVAGVERARRVQLPKPDSPVQ